MIVQELKKRGYREGIQQGMQQGMQKGIFEEKRATARALIIEGMDSSKISKVTGLPIEEIEKIRSSGKESAT